MRQVTVDVRALKAILETNMWKHQRDYEKALGVWRSETSAALVELAERITAGTDKDYALTALAHQQQKPESHVADYEKALAMLEMHTEPTIEIENLEFTEYVQDEWRWKRDWLHSNSKYLDR